MNEINKENQENNLKIQITEKIPLSEDLIIHDSNPTYSEFQKSSQKINYLLKALHDFSNRYDMDARNILTGKKFLLSFNEIISLIKDVIDYQSKIIELDISEKEKIQEISQDYINNLSYTIFSFDKIDILNYSTKGKINSKHNQIYNNHTLYNKKYSKTLPRFSFSNSIMTTNNNKEEIPDKDNKSKSKYSNYLKENENQRIKINKIENENKKEKKSQRKEVNSNNYNSKSIKKYKININNKEIKRQNSQNLKIYDKTKNRELKNKNEERKAIKREDTNNKINKNKKITNLKTKIYASNIKSNYNIPKTTKNPTKKESNGQIEYALKNNSVILRSYSANINNRNNKLSIMDNYNSLNDLEKKILDSQLTKEGYIIKGKINIFNNVPKPSILANKLLESSIKYINDYNGVNEEEKKRNNYNKHNHTNINKKKK